MLTIAIYTGTFIIGYFLGSFSFYKKVPPTLLGVVKNPKTPTFSNKATIVDMVDPLDKIEL